jgi:hypothetical protein
MSRNSCDESTFVMLRGCEMHVDKSSIGCRPVVERLSAMFVVTMMAKPRGSRVVILRQRVDRLFTGNDPSLATT